MPTGPRQPTTPQQGRVETHRLDQVASTIDQARAMIESGRMTAPDAPRAIAIIARQQTAGRGRRGDPWLSPPGGLWMTLARRAPSPTPTPDAIAMALALTVARVAERTLERHATPALITIKPPNDILVASAKLAGCIAQVVAHEGTDYVLASIGLNVNNSPAPIERTLDRPVASLATLAGRDLHLDPLASDLIAELTTLLDTNPDSMRAEYDRRTAGD